MRPPGERPEPPSPEEMQRRREEMFDRLNLTVEQRERMEALEGSMQPGQDPRAMRQAMEEILTTEDPERHWIVYDPTNGSISIGDVYRV